MYGEGSALKLLTVLSILGSESQASGVSLDKTIKRSQPIKGTRVRMEGAAAMI